MRFIPYQIIIQIILLNLLVSIGFAQQTEKSYSNVDVIRIGVPPNHKCSFVISGEIKNFTYSKFFSQLYTKRNPENCKISSKGKMSKSFIKTVTLRKSIGGDLNVAFEIMKLIRRNNFITHIDTLFTPSGGKTGCLSSCSLIFASGKHRHFTQKYKNTVFDNGFPNTITLGIHKPDFTEGTYDYLKKEKMLDEIKYKIISFLDEGGIDPRFTIEMFETSNEKIKYPSIEDLLIWQVVTSLEDPYIYKGLDLIKSENYKFNDNVFLDGSDLLSIHHLFRLHKWLIDNESKKSTEDYKTVSDAFKELDAKTSWTLVK